MTQALIHTARPDRSATISDCGKYRYSLERATGTLGYNLAWLMLNPSTADADRDDPTIRKVVGFTRRNGFGVALVVNLFAYRATDPKDCRAHLAEAEGEWNRKAILEAADISNAVVCAWGATPWAAPQAARVLGWLKGYKLLCLGKSKSGAPLHPLMPSYDGHPLVPFTAAQAPRKDSEAK